MIEIPPGQTWTTEQAEEFKNLWDLLDPPVGIDDQNQEVRALLQREISNFNKHQWLHIEKNIMNDLVDKMTKQIDSDILRKLMNL